MKIISNTSIIAAMGMLSFAFTGLASAKEDKPEKQSHVQLAILLDTSNSMDGLIDQAKSQLWSIINTFNKAERDGKSPYVEVALYEYGNDGLSEETGYIRQVMPMSRDLDGISERLFGLKTNGGSEFCGSVVKKAVISLDWDDDESTYKAIFIAGNEPFNQGPIDPGEACRLALEKHIIVNTIHCGDETVGANTGWKSGALMAKGEYNVIDQNKRVVHIEAPQDKLIIELNGKLNKTYLYFGADGRKSMENQMRQDANAFTAKESGAHVNRAVTKATANYCNATWDLVDASKAKDFDLSKVDQATLPEELKNKNAAEQQAIITAKQNERAEIQAEIARLNTERESYVKKQREKLAGESGLSLDDAISGAVKKQASSLGYSFGG